MGIRPACGHLLQGNVTFSGLALVIVGAHDQAVGEMTVTAEAKGLNKASLVLKSEKNA